MSGLWTQVVILTGWKIYQLKKNVYFFAVYKISSGAERLTQIRKITFEKHS